MRYKAILLDVDGTIMDFDAAEENALNSLLCWLKLGSEAALTYRKINDNCWELLEKGELSPDVLKIRRFEEFVAHYGLSQAPQEVSDMYLKLLSEQYIPFEGAVEVVQQIAQVLPIAIVTNGIALVQRGRLEKSPLWAYIKECIISEEIGYSKPDPQMLTIALDRLGIRKEDALMVGDGLSSDVKAANAAGIDMCWVNMKHLPRPSWANVLLEIDDIRALPMLALA